MKAIILTQPGAISNLVMRDINTSQNFSDVL